MAERGHERQAVEERAARGRRDDSLRRVRSLTKGVAVAVAAAVGVLGFYVAKALPGHSSTPTSQSSGTTTPSPAATAPSAGQSGQAATSPSVTAPPSPPAATQQPVHVSTGAS